MRTKQFLTSVAFELAFGVGACTPMTRNAMSNARSERTTLMVENNNWSDLTLYLVRDGSRHRIGSAPSMTQSVFVISSALLSGTGEIRIMADPIGSRQAWTSQPFMVSPGSKIRFRFENNVNLSTYAVY